MTITTFPEVTLPTFVEKCIFSILYPDARRHTLHLFLHPFPRPLEIIAELKTIIEEPSSTVDALVCLKTLARDKRVAQVGLYIYLHSYNTDLCLKSSKSSTELSLQGTQSLLN